MSSKIKQLILKNGLLSEKQIFAIELTCKRVNVREMLDNLEFKEYYGKLYRSKKMREFETDLDYLQDYLQEGPPITIRDIDQKEKRRESYGYNDKVYLDSDIQLQMNALDRDIKQVFLESELKESLRKREIDTSDPFIADLINQFMNEDHSSKDVSELSEDLDTIQLLSADKEAVILGFALLMMDIKQNIPEKDQQAFVRNMEMWKLQAIAVKYIHRLIPTAINVSGDQSNSDDFEQA